MWLARERTAAVAADRVQQMKSDHHVGTAHVSTSGALRTSPEEAPAHVDALASLIDLDQIEAALDLWRRLRELEGEESRSIPQDLVWQLFTRLEIHPERLQLLAYLMSEADTKRPDWRPVLVERVRLMQPGHLAGWVRRDVRGFLEALPAEERTLLHRVLWSVLDGGLTPLTSMANLRDAVQRGSYFSQVLLYDWDRPDRTRAYRAAAAEVLPTLVEANLRSRDYDAVLQALQIASVFGASAFSDLLRRCREHFAELGEVEPGAAGQAVASLMRAHLQTPRAPSGREGPLRIAVCVSGQMRGYRDAFPSWAALGLTDHQTHYFVHTWNRLGGKPPGVIHADRSFQPPFADAYGRVVAQLGPDEVARRYPRLFHPAGPSVTENCDPNHIRDLYDADAVVAEDESHPLFTGRSNFWKMHYKISGAHRLALASGLEFDLYIRIRPDREVASVEPIDWRRIAHRCAAENLIFVDESLHYNIMAGYAIGDQFAVGARPGMDAYSATFDFVEQRRGYGAPTDHVPHVSLALAAFHAGVGIDRMAGIGWGSHLNSSRLPDPEVAALLRLDIGARPPDEFDQLLLEGCRAPS
jgi:hypothetical protein